MTVFSQLKTQLKAKLHDVIENKHIHNGLVIIRVEQCCSVDNQLLLSWLKAQHSFPKYYWQNRDNTLTLTSIGVVKYFQDIEKAQQFSTNNHCTLIGGMQFSGETSFILPRLLFAKKEHKVTACLVVDSRNWEKEKIAIDQLFANFEKTIALEKTPYSLLDTAPYTNFQQWSDNIQNTIEHIKQGDFNKIVLANATDLICKEPISAYRLLALSKQKNYHCFHFLWQETQDVSFIGSSPERLYKREQQTLYTEALAGTAMVTGNQKQTEENGKWLLNDPKNNIENQYVVDDICDNLKSYAKEIEVKDTQLKQLPNVQHLCRLIKMELKDDVSDAQCLSHIHPTAAVAGLPRKKAIPFITQTENFERNWYAGTLGFFNAEQAEFCVTLRSALINKNSMTVYAGAGIVQDSEPESEWKEIQRKALAMIKLLQQ
ncbi:isochorismate synthase [Pasteurella skyensis]|uniref:Isochorismate synthase MenF n=1 Tax=Phocoenobacter skyensis TaxID=97481 RepID=A0AAJ6N9T6_9PAST|nr:isochorismate synthase [Pasteurella skyensis]MDP8162990.1 isochorismate synthase [Pasteurella skyensis]MDP8172858.1 isochorismate synthase [Pasteurella skyensis]MDP8176696.1 isochorismate synthase [Pasteurella skyensis]MDP8179358.1 isochorismate synthase [Pasteurella skyensis]MDP8183600.1 isochorismate synthase [Pasteurella skyensis]